MIKEKEEGFRVGEKWTSKYLIHTPLERVYRKIAEQEEIEEFGMGQEHMTEQSDVESQSALPKAAHNLINPTYNRLKKVLFLS